MGSKLKQNLSNLYYQRRNVLSKTPGRITALVENGADVPIWERMLMGACPQRRFDVRPYQHGMNKTESKPLIIQAIMEKGGDEYIGCVDSDQDRFLESKKYPDGLFYPKHKLFQTYGYSIESLLCLPTTLEQVYTTATSFQCGFKFDVFFKQVSEAIYPLAMTDLYLRQEGSREVFNVDDWEHVFPGTKVIRQALAGEPKQDIIASLAANANKYLHRLERLPLYDNAKYNSFLQQFHRSFPYVTNDNCVLFIYGHALFAFVAELIEELRNLELNAEIQSVYRNTQMEQHVKDRRVEELKNLQLDIPTVLKTNYEFIHNGCLLYQMIRQDLTNL